MRGEGMPYTTEEMREYQKKRREGVKPCKTDDVKCKTDGAEVVKQDVKCKTVCKTEGEIVKPRHGFTDTGEPYFPPEPTLPNGYTPKSSFELRYLYKKSHPNEICMVCLDHNRACKCDPFAVKKFMKASHSTMCDCLACKGADKKEIVAGLQSAV